MPDGSSNRTKITASKATALAAKHHRERQEAILARAYAKRWALVEVTEACTLEAYRTYKIVHASVFAALAGKQNSRNAASALNDAILAAARVVRKLP